MTDPSKQTPVIEIATDYSGTVPDGCDRLNDEFPPTASEIIDFLVKPENRQIMKAVMTMIKIKSNFTIPLRLKNFIDHMWDLINEHPINGNYDQHNSRPIRYVLQDPHSKAKKVCFMSREEVEEKYESASLMQNLPGIATALSEYFADESESDCRLMYNAIKNFRMYLNCKIPPLFLLEDPDSLLVHLGFIEEMREVLLSEFTFEFIEIFDQIPKFYSVHGAKIGLCRVMEIIKENQQALEFPRILLYCKNTIGNRILYEVFKQQGFQVKAFKEE